MVLDEKTKKSIEAKTKNLVAAVSEVEKFSGLKYPAYLLTPFLLLRNQQTTWEGWEFSMRGRYQLM